jgi:MFS family permease
MCGEKLTKSSGSLRSFQHRNFRLWFFASFLGNMGTWAQRIAQYWLVLELTDDAFQLGIVAGLQSLPYIILSSFGGKLADRFSMRKMIILLNLSASLWAAILGVLVISGDAQIWHVYIIATLLGISSAIESPITQSFLTQLVPPEDISNSISLRSVNFNTARLFGPAVSGFMINAFGTGPSFLFNALSFIFVIWALALMNKEDITEVNPLKEKVYIKEAIEYINARPDLKALLLVVFFFGTFAALPELFSATMATKVFDKNALDFGVLGSCIAVGSMSGSMLATKFEWKPSTRSVIMCTCWWGVAIIISSLAPTYFWYALILPVYGAIMLITGISALRTAQLGIDSAIRGRIMGIYISVSMGGVVFGAPLIGWITEFLGPREAVACSGALTIIGSTVVYLRFRGRLEAPADLSISATLGK